MAHKKKKTAPRGLGDLARFGGHQHAPMTGDEPLPMDSGDGYPPVNYGPRTLGELTTARTKKKKGGR